ncbi:MAG: sensor domain-containing diguanylate cyclase [Lachnospiraceae bacterium]|nr:sensor domain-containing diguanylate cyclase [Lachnospiraceae bacterium]
MTKEKMRVQNTDDALDKTRMLAYNFYTARDPAGVMCFYDAREVCWFGISAREEAFSFRSLQAAMTSLLSNMLEYDLAEEQYQVLYSGEDSCLVAGSFELHDSGRMAELKRMSCFWTLKEGEWRLNRLRLSLPQEDPDQGRESADELVISRRKGEMLVDLNSTSLIEYTVESDRMEMYLSEADGRRRYRVLKKYSQVSQRELETWIHAQDQSKIRSTFRSQQMQRTIEFRTLDEEGDYRWCRMFSQKIYDDGGRLRKILGVIQDISQEKELIEEAWKDSLTGTYNRHGMKVLVGDYCRFLLQQSRRIKGAALLLDLDNFGSLNETLGRETGDQILKDVVTLLRSRFRSDDKIFRTGGDEFLVLMKDVPDRAVVQRKGENLIEEFAEYAARYDVPEHPLSLSIGALVFDQTVSGAEEIFRCAHSALQQVKQKGKQGIVVCQGE